MLRQIVGWSVGVIAILHVLSVLINDGKNGMSGSPVGRAMGLYAFFVEGMAWWYLI